jgi:hypothetical protein
MTEDKKLCEQTVSNEQRDSVFIHYFIFYVKSVHDRFKTRVAITMELQRSQLADFIMLSRDKKYLMDIARKLLEETSHWNDGNIEVVDAEPVIIGEFKQKYVQGHMHYDVVLLEDDVRGKRSSGSLEMFINEDSLKHMLNDQEELKQKVIDTLTKKYGKIQVVKIYNWTCGEMEAKIFPVEFI